jgi:hypothetical protein
MDGRMTKGVDGGVKMMRGWTKVVSRWVRIDGRMTVGG